MLGRNGVTAYPGHAPISPCAPLPIDYLTAGVPEPFSASTGASAGR